MEQNFSSVKAAGLGVNTGIGYPPNASWTDPNNITLDDGSDATIGFFAGFQFGDDLVSSQYGFSIPDAAIIDGIEVNIDGSNSGCWGTIILSPGGFKDAGAVNGSYGGPTDLWGLTSIDPSVVNDSAFGVSVFLADLSGGDGYATVDYITITVYYHLDISTPPADVPTRVAYKVYSRDNKYLGELPNVVSRLGFTQDKGSAGSSLDISCAKDLRNITEVDPLMAEDGSDLLTEDDLIIYAEYTDLLVVTGDSEDDALFKNSNRIKAWLYNYWWPNGKLMFSGQVNRIDFSYGKQSDYANLKVFSDGYDLSNFIARGYPFSYTNDVSQTTQNGYATASQGGVGPEWVRYGQTWQVGGGVTNVGAITLKLRGSAAVTLSIYDGIGGSLIGSVTQSVAAASGGTDITFEFPQLLEVTPGETYFMVVSVGPGQSIGIFRNTSNVYANGKRYESIFAGGGGGAYNEISGDFYFVTKSGVPTTTTTYSSDDPVTEMMAGILTDYNNRGGYITERDFDATGLSLTYTFNSATIFDALKKVIELSPAEYYSYIDLGTAEMDILPTSTAPDFYVVKGKDINELDIGLTIEQVKNYLLFSGGDTGGGVNLYRDYQDSASASNFGLRTVPQTDNRVTLAATANAIGETFIEENAAESQETSITVLNESIDITLLTPGKTVGFKNFGNFIDQLVLQIVRREYNPDSVTLTLGRLPATLSAEVQRINRDLLNEQTVANPSSPS